ncbi:MAG TPA: sigma-70 family RNA polymerase sigma factor [Candidatus Acidoferrales bacterium]|nr:sigma-70 family RNA polymerase sigma factor [Candidatus Acidoferrales bacterium]
MPAEVKTLDRAGTSLASPEAAPVGAPSMGEGEFRAFYERTAPQLRAYLRRVSGDSTLADDMLQESYLRLLHAPLAPAEEQHRKNYLFRIATNLLRDHFRAARRMVPGIPEVAVRSHAADDFSRRHDLEPYFLQLKPRERELLWLAYVEGYSHDEIAETLKCRTASIRSMLFRARERLANLLRAHGWKNESSGVERS